MPGNLIVDIEVETEKQTRGAGEKYAHVMNRVYWSDAVSDRRGIRDGEWRNYVMKAGLPR